MNNNIKIEYRGKHVFDLAMQLAFTDEYEKKELAKVVGYKIHNNTMFLFSYKGSDPGAGFIDFPYAMTLAEIIPFVWGWLNNTKPTEREPDTDGSVKQGFCTTTEGTDWHGGSGFYGSFVAIKPTWIVYGK